MEFKYELKKLLDGYEQIIGCDEVGRGCLAGPVVACAVILNSEILHHKSSILNLKEVKDSKLMTSSQRERIAPLLKEICLWSIGIVSEKEIDQINIHNASLLAMRKAVEGLCVILASEPESKLRDFHLRGSDNRYLFIDGKFLIPNFSIPQEAVVGGDNKVMSIAAASIIAKVYRDQLMNEFDKQFVNYGFGKHKGYATLEHRNKIKKFGLTPIHRVSFCH